MPASFKRFESKKIKDGFSFVCGVDEAGRGCLAGPLSIGMVLFDDNLRRISGINDSKLLSHKKRLEIYNQITKSCYFKHVFVDAAIVDSLGLTAAQVWGVDQMIAEFSDDFKQKIDFIFIDGKQRWNFKVPSASIIKGDQLLKSIAAASIIAKVRRDLHMHEQANIYPKYGFREHVGYGTRQHLLALDKYGVSPIHRLSYAPVKKALENSAANS